MTDLVLLSFLHMWDFKPQNFVSTLEATLQRTRQNINQTKSEFLRYVNIESKISKWRILLMNG